MKIKKILALGVLLVSFTMFSQTVTEKAVGDFNKIKVYDLIAVNLIKSDENKVVIQGDNLDDLQVVNQNGTLKIRMALSKIFHGENTFVEVYFKELNLIDGSEGAKIQVDEMLVQESITLNAKEGAAITVALDVAEVDSRSVTGGIVEASGTTKSLKVALGTGGIFDGKSLQSDEASVKVTAAGEATVHATEKVDINIRAGGDVVVYGNPKEINKNTFAGGRVKVME